MRQVERKEVTRTQLTEVTTGRLCDCCQKPILPVKNAGVTHDVYSYFLVCTSHNDWGDESHTSFESFDACSAECATKMTEAYLMKAAESPWNTKRITIEHVRTLDDGASNDERGVIDGMER